MAVYDPLSSVTSPGVQKSLSKRELDILARTIAGEIDPRQSPYGNARNRQEIANILETIATRAALSGKSFADVATEKNSRGVHQYSTWNEGRSRRNMERNYTKFGDEITKAVNDYFTGKLQPTHKGLTNYYSPSGMLPRFTAPGWAKTLEKRDSPQTQVGPHIFYADMDRLGATQRQTGQTLDKMFSGNMPRPYPIDGPGEFVGNLPRSRDVALANMPKAPIGRGEATAALGPGAASAKTSSAYPGDLPASLAWDDRFYSPTLQGAWQSSARPEMPQPNLVPARANSGFAPTGQINPSTASAIAAQGRGLSGAASGGVPVNIPLAGSAMAGMSPTVAAEANRAIPTRPQAIPVTTVPVTPTPRPQTLTGQDAAKWAAGFDRLASAYRQSPQNVAQQQLPTVAPELPTPQTPKAPGGGGWMDDPLGALKSAMATAAEKAAPALQKAEEGLKVLSNPFVQALLSPGPVQRAVMSGQTGGPAGFWGGNIPDHLIGQASYEAAKMFGSGNNARPSVPAPSRQPSSQQPAQGSTPSWASGFPGFTTSGGSYVELPNGNIVKI